MKLSSKQKYAVTVVQLLKANGMMVSHEITKEMETSAPYLEQIMAGLRKSGVVKTIRGCFGGYRLGCEVVRMSDIINSFGGFEKGNNDSVSDFYNMVQIMAEDFEIT